MKRLMVLAAFFAAFVAVHPARGQFSNARSIQGRAVCSDAPTNTQVYAWSASRNCWAPAAGGGGSGCVPSSTAGKILLDDGAGGCTDALVTIDNTGNISTPGGVSSGVGGSIAGVFVASQGTAPTFGAGAGQIPTTGYNGWVGPASGVVASYGVQVPVVVPTANQLMIFPAPTSSLAQGTWIGVSTGVGGIPKVIAAGTASMGTTAVASGVCSSAIDGGTATGVLTTDVITATANADPVAVTGYTPATTGTLYIWSYPTADHVNFKLCNNTSSSITPGSAVTLNWKVIR